MQEEIDKELEELADDERQRDRMMIISDKIIQFGSSWMGGTDEQIILTKDDIIQIAFDLEQEI